MDANGASGTVGQFNMITVNPPRSLPFRGLIAVPGTIEAENFDDGGEAGAYHDSSSGNSGGSYRATDVDIEASSDTTDGFNVGWAVAGEWLLYTVHVQARGTYDLEVRVASDGPGGLFHLEDGGIFDNGGIDVTGLLRVPDTTGWQTWTSIYKANVLLGEGVHHFRLVMDTNGATGAVGNFNYMTLNGPR